MARQHHLLHTGVGPQPHRRPGQANHLMLVTIEDDPIAHPQHRTRQPHQRIPNAAGAPTAATSVSGDSGTDRSACNR